MELTTNSFGFNVGNFQCLIIKDGVINVPGKTRTSASRDFMAAGSSMEAMCLLVKTPKYTILMDTGLGVSGEPNAGKLVQNLRDAGINCSDIDVVIISHGHGDHIGGITDSANQVIFPNARFMMSKDEWEFWTSDPELKQLKVEEDVRQMFCKTVKEHLLPIKNHIDLIEQRSRILPGIECIKVPGHTPGNITIAISSDSESLFYTGDLFHHPLQIGEPELHVVFDYEPEQASRMRMQMLSEIIKPNILVSASHFPFPGLGYIKPKKKSWEWKSLNLK
jgi:glyoxylase-like metal-dependent hydrolase (beta-lactamase superfamily II)